MFSFDEFVTGAKKCFDVASEKGTELLEASKLQIRRSELNCKLKDEYARLGKICYEMTKGEGDVSEKMEKCVVKISKILEDIGAVEAAAASAKREKKQDDEY